MVVGIAQQLGLAELGHVALCYGKSGCHALWCGYYKRLIWIQRRKSASGTSASPIRDGFRICLTLKCAGFLWVETSLAIHPAIHRLADPSVLGISLTVRLVGIREPVSDRADRSRQAMPVSRLQSAAVSSVEHPLSATSPDRAY